MNYMFYSLIMIWLLFCMSKGCFPKLLSWVKGNIDIVGGLGIGVALFQVG